MKAAMFVKGVYLRVLLVTLLSIIVPLMVRLAMPDETIIRFILVCVASVVSTSIVIFSVGLDSTERTEIVRFVRAKISR